MIPFTVNPDAEGVTIIDDDQLQMYLQGVSKGEIRHQHYKKSTKHAQDMGVHVEGETPEELLKRYRPNETPEINEYRNEIWEPVTLGQSEKVINTFNKIFNTRFFKIDFPEMSVDEEENLATYTTEKLPEYLSLLSFVKETFTKKDFSDPNALLYIQPKEFEVPDDRTRWEPIPIIFPAESVVDFQEGEFYTVMLNKKAIKIITGEAIRVFIESDKSNDKGPIWVLLEEHPHGIGKPPAFRLGGIVKGVKDPYWYFSFIGGVLPHWNRAVTLTSDLDASYVSHMYLESYQFVAQDCDQCGGTGEVDTVINIGGEEIKDSKVCHKCKGSGTTKSPYGELFIRHDALNPEAPLPTPPKAYIPKPTEIVTIVSDRIAEEKREGLSAINFEILNDTPQVESGIAKAIDRQDMDASLMRYSKHIFKVVLPKLYWYISYWRYGVEFDWSEERIKAIQPVITPLKEGDFTVLSLQYLSNEYKEITGSGNNRGSAVSTSHIRHVEEELVNNRFSGNEFERKKNVLIVRLRPFPGADAESLLTLQNLDGVEPWMIYLQQFVERLVQMAIEEDEEFLDKTFRDKRETIEEMAKAAVNDSPGNILTEPGED